MTPCSAFLRLRAHLLSSSVDPRSTLTTPAYKCSPFRSHISYLCAPLGLLPSATLRRSTVYNGVLWGGRRNYQRNIGTSSTPPTSKRVALATEPAWENLNQGEQRGQLTKHTTLTVPSSLQLRRQGSRIDETSKLEGEASAQNSEFYDGMSQRSARV